MKYFVDTKNKDEIIKWKKELGTLYAGATTNNIMFPEGTLSKVIELFKDDKVNGFSIQNMIQVKTINQIELLKDIEMKCVVKIPMLKENFKLFEFATSASFYTAATTCYDLIQINNAIELGCEYTMVYYAKNPYKHLLEDAYELKQKSNSDIKLVGASIHTVDEVLHAINCGMDYVTVRPDVLELLFNNRNAVQDIHG